MNELQITLHIFLLYKKNMSYEKIERENHKIARAHIKIKIMLHEKIITIFKAPLLKSIACESLRQSRCLSLV